MRSVPHFLLLSFISLSTSLHVGWTEESPVQNQTAHSADWNEVKRRANEHLREGRVTEAVAILDTAIQAARNRGERGAEMAKFLNDLGSLYHDLDRLRDAEHCYIAAISIVQRCSCGDKTLAIAVHNLANIRLREGRYSDAEKLLRRAERLTDAAFGSDSPEIAAVYSELADTLLSIGRYREARERGERAVSLLENSVKDSRLGFALAVLAKVAWHAGQFNEAESLFRRSIAAWLLSVGPSHESYASGIAGLAVLISPTKREEADQLFRQALDILEAKLGPNHQQTASAMLQYTNHLESHGQKAEAKALKRRAELSLAEHARRNQLGFTVDVQSLAPTR
jgi:tetratricopeptide (TPR) repeat protein